MLFVSDAVVLALRFKLALFIWIVLLFFTRTDFDPPNVESESGRSTSASRLSPMSPGVASGAGVVVSVSAVVGAGVSDVGSGFY